MDQPLHQPPYSKPPSTTASRASKANINWPLTLSALYATLILACGTAYLWPTESAAFLVACLFFWVAFLTHDYRRKVKNPSNLKALGMICHTFPALFLYGTCCLADAAENRADVWFVFLLVFRYWRTVVQIFFWFRYKPARPTKNDAMKPDDCTVLIPTVGPYGNSSFEDLLASILTNSPARVVFSTNTKTAAKNVNSFLTTFRPAYEAGTTAYQLYHDLPGTPIINDIQTINTGMSSKRNQVVTGLAHAHTAIVVSTDDTASWTPTWLHESLAAFNDPSVGLVGTRKWVKHLPPTPTNPANTLLHDIFQRWYARFWNNMGGLYLTRHNFEMQSSNAADGGVFCVSGRSSLIRRSILSPAFQHAFTNEFVLGAGPVQADDDNFITRWVLAHGWRVKVQCQMEATMTTVLGQYPHGFKFFPAQCARWSRSTMRQNPIALFLDRNVWWEWPLTVWTTYVPWLYNAALVWDGLALIAFSRTTFFTNAQHPYVRLLGLFYAILMTKLVKTAAWWVRHPLDFLLFFVVPAYPVFVYRHSVLKIWTMFTALDMEWSGRKLEGGEDEGKGNGGVGEKKDGSVGDL